MKEQITEPGDLHDENGHLLQKGWAWKPILKHKRENIKVSSLKIKDWDCYIIYNENYSIGLIIADVGYFGMATFDWIDFKAKGDTGIVGSVNSGSALLITSATERGLRETLWDYLLKIEAPLLKDDLKTEELAVPKPAD